MTRVTMTGNKGTLDVQREVIPVHYLSDIDANWRFTDAAGHAHHCEYTASDHYPTLIRVTDETYWCGDCDDEHELARLECRQCGEHVTPGITGPGTKFLQGAVTYRFNGEVVSEERAREIIAEWNPRG
jgi:hypothetical protein